MAHPPNLPLPKNKCLDADIYSQPGVYAFITLRSFGQSRPFTNAPLAAMIIQTLLAEQERLGCQVAAYCLMTDHLHYLITPTSEGRSVLVFTDQFKGKSTHLSWGLGWTGKLWQPRSYDHVLRSDESWKIVAEYILLNPVRKGYVAEWADWEWSGLLDEQDTP